MGDYKVLVVVDIQNCFIQGGSLGSEKIEDLKKYIDLVKNVDDKISKGNYDLVVFSKDIHPLNHSSLSDNTSPQYGVYTYHCRDTKKNCIKDTRNPAAAATAASATTYMSSAAKEIIKNILCDVNVKGSYGIKHSYDKDHFYDRKSSYEEDDYNFYNPIYKDVFTRLLKTSANEIKEQVKNEMDDKDYDINKKQIKTLQDLIDKYIKDVKLDDNSKRYLEGIKDKKYKSSKVQGLDLNYLFYGTNLKEIIYALNTNSDSEIGITQEEHIEKPDYNDEAYNVNSIVHQTNNTSTKFITIAKGQYCDYESYSAFNYHTEIKKQDIKGKSIIYDVFKKFDSTLNDLNPLPAEKRYSTGLFEYILKSFDEQYGDKKTIINIDVCGLVTNICVVNTVHQGIAMWEKVYKGDYKNITCKFNLLEYLSIPLPVPVPIPYLKYNYALQINKEADLGKMLLQVSNLQTLLTTKFEDDVLTPNPSIRNEKISYTVDFNINLQKILTEYINQYINQLNQINQNIISSTLNFTHITPQTGGKKLKKAKAAPKRAPKTAKAAPKKAKAAPKTAKAAPKTAKAAPKTAKAAPKKAKAAPKTAKAAPKTAKAAPKKAKAAPKTAKAAPKRAPKTAKAAPKTAKAAKAAP
jgi:nicotinamidase-related amidase